MTTINTGMTPAQFITAMNNNFTELVTAWDVNAASFTTLTTSNTTPTNVNHNLRATTINYGQKGRSFIDSLNSGFGTTVQRFQDNYIHDILSPETVYGEPTAILNAAGTRIDLWVFLDDRIHHSYSTDGLTFSVPEATDIPLGYKRNHVLLVGTTYYHYACGADDTTMHLFTGTNGINYTDQGEVIGLGGVGEWDHTHLGNIFVWKEGANWKAIYEGTTGVYWQMGYATSSNGTVWTKHASNPVIYELDKDVQGPELVRVNNEVIQHNGEYYIYYSSGDGGHTGVLLDINRAHSSDCITWTKEGNILDVLHKVSGYIAYGDPALIQFNGKSYMFQNPSNQVDAAYLDLAVDNRTLAELLALYP